MKQKSVILGMLAVLVLALLAAGCGADETAPAIVRLVREESVSFLTEQGDTIEYEIWVEQDQDDTITVTGTSNSEFFDGLSYIMAYDKPLSAADVEIKWTTLMGDPEPKEDDQWAVAEITISDGGQEISRRKINFVKNAMEIIAGITEEPEFDRAMENGTVNGFWNLF